MSAALTVEGLVTGYARLPVVQDASLVLAQRATVGLIGPNGAGKSTLLRAIAGVLPAFSGRILLDGADVGAWPAYRRARSGLVLVPEGRQILAGLTVEDNLGLTRAAIGGTGDTFAARRDEVYALFPVLAERRRQSGGSLSGGEQQMLAIARALLLRPRVLMLDEPTQGLAPIVIKDLAATLAALKGRFAVLIVEQKRSFLDPLADRILTMQAGRLAPADRSMP